MRDVIAANYHNSARTKWYTMCLVSTVAIKRCSNTNVPLLNKKLPTPMR